MALGGRRELPAQAARKKRIRGTDAVCVRLYPRRCAGPTGCDFVALARPVRIRTDPILPEITSKTIIECKPCQPCVKLVNKNKREIRFLKTSLYLFSFTNILERERERLAVSSFHSLSLSLSFLLTTFDILFRYGQSPSCSMY